MRVKVSHIALLAVILLFASCSEKEGGEVIPHNDFAKIYADMFISDQWIREHPETMAIADTTLIYEPIFNKYGYTTDDYLKSVDYYLYDPVRFSRILEESVEILEKKKLELQTKRGVDDSENPEDE